MKVQMDAPSVLAIAATLFKTGLLDAGRTEAKRYFRELEAGRELILSDMTMPDKSKLRIKLQLLPQEFRGKLNFSAYKEHLLLLTAELAKIVNAKSEPLVMSDDDGSQLLFNIPALTYIDGVLNALVLGADLRRPGTLVLQLMFIDPDQYRSAEVKTASS